MATPQDVKNQTDDEFGANDWLIEEMREQFLADPSSVDPSWVDYFNSHAAGSATPAAGTAAAAEPARN
ncbi:2-oxoglutarate dehydrogenase E1 subunit family protein, partial [Propionicimonas sp.]|uniref:2-oxoglutarate dehydrogenase E1 subunit family protein n=1 Tax=Propionicimonas sp. TaxID=1955623 RepID=UPI0039E2E3DF